MDRWLPDFDCVDNTVAQDILNLAASQLADVKELRQLGELQPGSPSALRLGAGYVEAMNWETSAELSDAALKVECPFAFMLLQVLRFGGCLFCEGRHPVCSSLRVELSDITTGKPYGLEPRQALPAFLNSRFARQMEPLLQLLKVAALLSSDHLDADDSMRVAFGCTENESWWRRYLALFVEQATGLSGPGLAELERSMPYHVERRYRRGDSIQECPMGFLTGLLELLLHFQTYSTERYHVVANEVSEVFEHFEALHHDAPFGSFTVIMLSAWPVAELLGRSIAMTQYYSPEKKPREDGTHYQHKPFELDFHRWELLRPSRELVALPSLQALPHEDHVRRLRERRRSSPSASYHSLLVALEDSLLAGQRLGDGSKLVLLTMVWGAKLAGYIPGALRRARALGLEHAYMVYCHGEACEACKGAHSLPSLCVFGKQRTIYNKYTASAAILGAGFDVFYLDFDVFLMRDPRPALYSAAGSHSVLVTRDFGSECLNTGVILFRADAGATAFVQRILVWLWFYAFEFSQKAFSAFLGVEQVFHKDLPPIGRVEKMSREPPPKWATLESTNQFVTNMVYGSSREDSVEGWYGELDEIVTYHFLDAGGVDPSAALAGKYINLYEMFYLNEKVDVANLEVPVWEQDPQLKEVMMLARHSKPPAALHTCKLI